MKTNSILGDFLLAAHPVGSYYWSKEDTNPSQLFGGTWEQVKDRFVLAAGDTYEVGNVGGEKEVSLTAAQNGPHNHDGWMSPYVNQAANWVAGNNNYLTIGIYQSNQATSVSGEGRPHNNMPPYIVAYCFVRVA